MSPHEQDRNNSQRGQGSGGGQSRDGGQDWRSPQLRSDIQPPRQIRALNKDLDQDPNQTRRTGQNPSQNPSQNPGQSLSPFQQGRQASEQPISSGGPRGFGAQACYGSQELRGQTIGACADAPVPGGYGQLDDPRQSYGPDSSGKGVSFGGAWGAPPSQTLTEGWGGQARSLPHRDPHYHAWRERQNRQFDEDWEEFNRERQTSFDDEFETWRKSRAARASATAADAVAETAIGSAGKVAGAGSDKDK